MEPRQLGATGLYVCRLALGTMTWSRDTDDDDASSQLTAFVEMGGTLMEDSRLQRGVEREAVPRAHDLGTGIVHWSSRGRCVLTGKYRTGPPAGSRGASPDYQRFVAPYLADHATRVVGAVMTAADG